MHCIHWGKCKYIEMSIRFVILYNSMPIEHVLAKPLWGGGLPKFSYDRTPKSFTLITKV